MKKKSYALLTYALAVLLGVALFLTSERVQRAERLYNEIQEKLVTEIESYHILQTEWTYLNRPDRLEELTATHLKLTPLKPETTLTSTLSLPILQVSAHSVAMIPKSPSTINTIESAAHTPDSTRHINTKILKISNKTNINLTKKQFVSKQKLNTINRNKSTAAVTFYQYMNQPTLLSPNARGK